MKKYLFALGAIAVLAFGCAKNEDFINPVFNCECGSITWDGVNYPLQMAEWVQADTGNFLSRRYFLTADIRQDGENKPHNLSIQLDIDSIDQTVHFIPADQLYNIFEEVNENDNLLPYRQYVCTNGVIDLSPAILGGEESVAAEMLLREVVGGDTVGFDIEFSMDFTVTIE